MAQRRTNTFKYAVYMEFRIDTRKRQRQLVGAIVIDGGLW